MERLSEIVLSFVINAAWQSTIISAIGLVLARSLNRRSPRLRFQLLVLTLAGAIVAPIITLLPRNPGLQITAVVPPVEARGALMMSGLYLAGLAFVFLRFVRSGRRAWLIAATSAPFQNGTRVSSLIDSPITIGRTVFVPVPVVDDPRLLAAALAHEGAHVRRNDYALHVALELLALPLYFHPLIPLLRRSIAEAREIACDEEAASHCGREDYATALVAIASIAARRRAGMAVSMAATPIERRIVALLQSEVKDTRRSMAVAVFIVPLLSLLACTRFNVAPAIHDAALCGRWSLMADASDLSKTQPQRYERFVQTIEQGPTRIAVRQERTVNGATAHVGWSVITDGVTRSITGIRDARGSATWRNGSLVLRLAGPGTHRETAKAFVREGRLVVDGKTERGGYHAVFQRIDP